MAKLRAALTGAAVSALVLTAVAPAAAASGGSGGTAAGGTTLVTTNVDGAATSSAAAPSGITVDPGVGRPGGSVDLRTFADCGGTETGTVGSAAFTAPVGLGLAADGGLFAEAQVAGSTRPGTYVVLERCNGRTVAAGTLKVVALGAPRTGGGWGATRVMSVADPLAGARGQGALALTGAAALGGLVLLGSRARGPRRRFGRG